MFSHKGYRIDVSTEGRFSAEITDDYSVSAETLAEVRTKIDRAITEKDKKPIALKVVGILQARDFSRRKESAPKVHRAVAIGINRTSRVLQYADLPKGMEMDDVLADTPENAALLESSIHAKATHERLQREIVEREIKVSSYGRIENGKAYDEALAELTAKHKKSAEAGAV